MTENVSPADHIDIVTGVGPGYDVVPDARIDSWDRAQHKEQ